MLVELQLKNFRGFEAHELPLRSLSVLVGRNNAGKSSMVEALRLIAIVTARYENLAYHPPREWLDVPYRLYGASLDLRNLQIDFDTLCYVYHAPPAVIEARFENHSAVHIYLGGENQVHAVVFDPEGNVARNRAEARRVRLPRVSIMPQVGPLAREERILNPDYVSGAMNSPLAPIHFRNQLKLHPESFSAFKQLAEETWPGLQIMPLEYDRGFPGDPLFLHVRNEEFVGEVAKMGHGLQMWLQTMWFLTRARDASTLILDEPDVYMHADLQRRLIRHLKAQGRQVVVATHSVEIMSEVDPDQILIIERKRGQSRFADSIPAVQNLVERVGSAHNLHLARLWNAKRFLIVEGDDLKILRHLHDTIFPTAVLSLESIPNMSIGGWGGWNWAIGSSLALRNAFGEKVTTYCIFDRDFHAEAGIKERYDQAAERGVELHVWQRKELENYLLNIAAIARLIAQRVSGVGPSPEQVLEIMQQIAESLRDEALDGLATEVLARNRGLGAGGANKKARQILRQREAEDGNLIHVVSGKQVLSKLSAWAQEEFSVSINPLGLARELFRDEIPTEVQFVLRTIEDGGRFKTE